MTAAAKRGSFDFGTGTRVVCVLAHDGRVIDPFLDIEFQWSDVPTRLAGLNAVNIAADILAWYSNATMAGAITQILIRAAGRGWMIDDYGTITPRSANG